LGIKVNGGGRIRRKLGALVRAVNGPESAEMLRIGFRVMDAMKQRTAAGIDAFGRKFAPYSKRYSQFKAKRGGGWLHDTGAMLSAMTVKAERGRVTVFFRSKASIRGGGRSVDENQKALVHNKGLGVNPKRHFFGLSKGDVQKITGRVRGRVRRAIR